MAKLETPEKVVPYLRAAVRELDFAHKLAGEKETLDDCVDPANLRTNLAGPIRDIIFGLNTSVEALASYIENELCKT